MSKQLAEQIEALAANAKAGDDGATFALLHTIYTSTPAIIAALRADQRCAELEAENARLREASIALRDDLLMRAEIDIRNGTKIVAASNGVWIRFNKALESKP